MKNLFIILFILTNILGKSQESTLILASDVWPPFTNVEGEKRITLDIVGTALERLSIENKIVIEDFQDVITGIESGQYSGSSALWYSEERAKEMIFSEPYLYNQLILVGRKGSDVSAISFDDLAEVKIGVVENYAYGEDLTKNSKIVIVKGLSDQKNLEALLAKKVDYILVDALLIQYLLKYQVNDVSEFLEIGNNPLSIKALHFALNKNIENSAQIIASFNVEISEMLTDGSYHEILELNWIKEDIDGDGKMEMVFIGNKAGSSQPSNAYSMSPSNMAINEGFYINGEFYLTWDQVPGDLKVNITESEFSNYHEGGIILKF
jgi:polar amino acid transport system substrate-binding protein